MFEALCPEKSQVWEKNKSLRKIYVNPKYEGTRYPEERAFPAGSNLRMLVYLAVTRSKNIQVKGR